jgi:lactate racemase
MQVHLAYGKEGLEFALPDNLKIDVVEPKYQPGLADQMGAVADALRRPIGTRPLAERVGKGVKVGIVFSDITRATPYHIMLPPLLKILAERQAEVVLFNATGTHRPNSEEELATILGEEIVRSYPVVQNDSSDEESHTQIGTTSRGNEVFLHREFLACDLKILTGFIEPHFFAGFSGGGKAMMPGLAQLQTIQSNHGAANMDDDRARWGITTGNPVWEEVHEVADMVENTFLLNVAMNRDKEITGVFAGSLRGAHTVGVKQVRAQAMVEVPHRYELVITGNSGYPLDLNMYQSVKGMSAAFQIVNEGADILLAADCWDGIPAHGYYGSLLTSVERPRELLERIRHAEQPVQDMWQAQIHAKICERTQVHFYSENLSAEEIEGAFMIPVENIEQEVEGILEEHLRRGGSREEFRICVLPEGPLTIPYYSH